MHMVARLTDKFYILEIFLYCASGKLCFGITSFCIRQTSSVPLQQVETF